jgi:hypothetical protein
VAALPHLNALDLDLFSPANMPVDLSWLPTLVPLTSLTLKITDGQTGESNNNLLRVLKQCTRLTHLGLTCGRIQYGYIEFNETQLNSLFESLPLLNSFHLQGAYHLRSLSFLSAGALSTTVSSLTLRHFGRNIPLDQIECIYALKSLETLVIGCYVFPRTCVNCVM